MALSRLLISEVELHLTKEGFSGSRRWLCVPPPREKVSKKSESTKEKRTKEVRSFLERYKEEHPGLFPKITEVHKAIGGSYTFLRGVVSKFKENFLIHSADTTQQGKVAKPCPNKNSSESMNEISLASARTKKCAVVPNETTTSSSIEVLNENNVAPPVDEKPPNVDLDSLRVDVQMADTKNIDFELRSRKRDFKQKEHFSGSKTRSTYNEDAQQSENLIVHNTKHLYKIIKGLQYGPESILGTTSVDSKATSTLALGNGTSKLLSMEKKELLDRRDLNVTKASSLIENDNKMSVLFDAFKQMKNKPKNDVEGMVRTNNETMCESMIREENVRSGADYDQLENIFSQVITKTEKQSSRTTSSLVDTLPNKNILNKKTKGIGRITELWEEGGSVKIMENEDDGSDITASGFLDLQPTVVAPAPITKRGSKYGMFVSFLDKSTSESDVYHAFKRYGPLHEVHITSSRKLDPYKCANVFFKAEQGLKNALSNTDPVICDSDVVVQPMISHLSKRSSISADKVVQDPDFPSNLLKFPSQSVAVKGLMQDIPFDCLKHALGFSGPISGIAIGQSCSSVYVEFESEESKERVLEAAKVNMLGKSLQIHRVTAPKTTVARVSRVNCQTNEAKIKKISNRSSDGSVKRVVQRAPNIFDVHFKLTMLPNILEILNRMNGLVVDGSQWLVQPATFIPVEIIQSLWDDPRGCTQVQDIFRKLCMKAEGNSYKNSFDLWSTVETEE